jgi:hypothetical protein
VGESLIFHIAIGQVVARLPFKVMILLISGT